MSPMSINQQIKRITAVEEQLWPEEKAKTTVNGQSETNNRLRHKFDKTQRTLKALWT